MGCFQVRSRERFPVGQNVGKRDSAVRAALGLFQKADCDRLGDRIEVFDKMGNFKRNIRIQSKTAHRTNSENAVGTAGWVSFSPDPAQKFMYVANGADNVIHILDRTTGEVLARFGRPGNQSGDLTDPHSIAVNSKGDIIIGEVPYGGKIQMWRAVRK